MSTPGDSVRRRRILINTSSLVGSSLWRTLLTFVQFWFIARFLGVEALGQYSLGMAYLHVAAIASEVGLPGLMVRDLAQQPQHRRSQFGHLLLLQLFFALLIWLLLVQGLRFLPLSLAVQQAIRIGAAFLPLYAISSVALTLCRASERMDVVFVAEALGSALMLAGTIVLIWMGYGVADIFSVQIGAQLLVCVVAIAIVLRLGLLGGNQQPAAWDLIGLLRRSAPFYGVALSEVLLQRSQEILLGLVASDVIVGIFAAANNVVKIIGKMISSVWVALYPTLSRLRFREREMYTALVYRVTQIGNLLLLPVTASVMLFSPEVLHLIYANEISDGALVLRILAPSIIFYAYEVGNITILLVERAPLRSLGIPLFHLVILAVLVPLLGWIGGASGAAVGVLMGTMAGAGLSLALVRGYVRTADRQLPALLLITGVVYMFSLLSPAPWLATLVASAFVYLLFVWKTGYLDFLPSLLLKKV